MRPPPQPAPPSPVATGRSGAPSGVSVLGKSLVDPGVQTGQGSLDGGEDRFDVVVVAVIRVVDVEDISTGSGVEGPQHPDSVGADAQLLEQPHVVAGQRDHQVGLDVVDADLRGAMVGGVAVLAQPPVGPLVGALADVPAGGACTGHLYGVVQ